MTPQENNTEINPKISTEEAIKAAAIMHAVEVKSSFELYAYRIISHEQYIGRIIELVELFETTRKQYIKKEN